jgi:hypothetical protein
MSISGDMHARNNKNRDITQLLHGRSDGCWVRQAITTRWTHKWFVIPVAYHERSDVWRDSWISDACQQTLEAQTPCSTVKWREGHILMGHLVVGHALVRARLMAFVLQCLALSERAAAAERALSRRVLLPQSARGAELKLNT